MDRALFSVFIFYRFLPLDVIFVFTYVISLSYFGLKYILYVVRKHRTKRFVIFKLPFFKVPFKVNVWQLSLRSISKNSIYYSFLNPYE